MYVIYKYPFEIEDEFSILMPEDASILTVRVQGYKPCIWAHVDPEKDDEERHFILMGTGHQIDETIPKRYIGTFQLLGGGFIGHLFEKV